MPNAPKPQRPSAPDTKRGRRPPLVSLPSLLCALALWIAPAFAVGGFDINTADAAALAAELPGIGPVKAARIVAHRDAHGPFVDLGALIAVPGIGPKTLEGIRRRLGGAAPPSSRDERGEGREGVRAPSGRVERDVPTGAMPATDGVPPRSTSELEAGARLAVRRLVELARADAAHRGVSSHSSPLASAHLDRSGASGQ